ncbi:hypothetical protein BGX34_003905 [Mortierella sp. NVP85]|nr:hypothetical protein BGX34_003905 [Mortierella sp. NVP85]
MTSSVEKALQLPEVLDAIARRIPLFEVKFSSYPSSYNCDEYDEDTIYTYQPHHLLSCTLVSRLWNSCFSPHLYHYYYAGTRGNRSPTTHDGFQRNHHHIRRVLSVNASLKLPFTSETLPRNLVDLRPSSFKCNTSNLLFLNQGARLKRLYCRGRTLGEMEQVYEDALKDLPCLEELELGHWRVNNEVLHGILSNCSETLRELKIVELKGFDERLPYYNGHGYEHVSGEHTGSPQWSLPHLKSLTMKLDHPESQASALLPRLCPALESIHIMMNKEIRSMPQLVSSLRGYCPNLREISLLGNRSFFSTQDDQGLDVNASLFKDSCPQGLQSVSISLPRGLDEPIKDALLLHVNTLVRLELQSIHDMYNGNFPRSMNMKAVGQLLECCVHLRKVRLWSVSCYLPSVAMILAAPWGCRGLEELVISGYYATKTAPPSMEYEDLLNEESQRGQEQLESERKGTVQSAQLRKLPHHEYRDDGQGWFLKHGLKKNDLLEALADGDWKRQLFEHMYTTSGIRQAKYVRLNTTEFFAREQPLNGLATGRN